MSVRVPMLAVAGAALLLSGCGGGSRRPSETTTSHGTPAPIASRTVAVPVLRLARRASLAAGVQAPATASLGGSAVLAGGLDQADTSVAAVTVAKPSGAASAPALPQAIHDAAAASIGGAAFVFGGGEPSHAEIVRIGPGVTPALAGRLPTAASDVAAASIGSAAYIVGGYDGANPLDTIVRWSGGGTGTVVGHLPAAVRYAAVAAAAGRLIIAGGTVAGAASRSIYAFDPATGHVSRIGRLPHPLTHASATAVGDVVYVIGGRGSAQGTQTRTILAIASRTGRVTRAGHLPVAVSDAGAATVGGQVLVAGGREASGTVSDQLLTFTAGRVLRRFHGPLAAAASASPLSSVPEAGLRGLNVYAADARDNLSPAVAGDRPLVYVPNSASDTVDEIDPATFKVVRHFPVGGLPQHVVPSWDLRTLYVTNDAGNSLTPIDPRTGDPGHPIPVEDPYNLYFTPDGRFAVVMAERLLRIDFRDAHTMALVHSLAVPTCAGVNHADYTADGRFMLATCEFGSSLVVVDIAAQRVLRTIGLPSGSSPQDVKLSPDGRVFYVADLYHAGVWTVDPGSWRVTGLIHTGAGAHGMYPSRSGRFLYVSNRSAGSISVISFRMRRVVKTWAIPGGGSPDMGNVSADGQLLWLSGRYNGVVYAFDTRTGRLRAQVPVGAAPHGVCVWPQPGRYSLGHTGILR